jgi:hypothetical protein
MKGLVLSGPVFDCTPGQWYASRLTSTAKALLIAAPLAAAYFLASRILHQTPIRFVATNLVGLLYMAGAVRWILGRRSIELDPVR